jgi:hypothetical protein
MFQFPSIIANPTAAKQPEKRVMEGILKSAILPSQKHAIDGIVSTGLPENKRNGHGPEMMRVEPGATKYKMGVGHIPGTKYGH